MCSGKVRAGEVIDDVLSEVEAALSRLDLAHLRELHEEHVGPVLERVAALADRFAAVRVATVGAVDDSAAPLRDGLRTASWVAKRTRCPARAARVDLRHDRVLRRLPHLAAAFRAGRVGQDHVAAFASLHHGLLAPLLERDERFLVPTAEACTFREPTEVLARWRLAADPDGPEPPEERRGFRLGPTSTACSTGSCAPMRSPARSSWR